MLDKDTISTKFDIIEKDLEFARELARAKPEEFRFKEEQAAKYTLLEISEACIDIASHIVAARGFRRAEEYAELFQILHENSILPKKLADSLASMAGMRNILVHRYADVSKSRLMDAIKNHLGDVEDFMRHIAKLVKEEK